MAGIVSGWIDWWMLCGGTWLVAGCTVPVDLVDDGASAGADGTGAAVDSSGGDVDEPDGDSEDESDDESGVGECPEGSDGCACAPDDECDDGLTCTGGTCLPASVCGDGIEMPGEDCDDGNDLDADGCNVDCRVSGSLLWSGPIGDQEYGSSALRVAIDSQDFIAVAGEDSTFILETVSFVSRLDATGELQWTVAPSDCWGTRGLAVGLADEIRFGCLRSSKTEPFLINDLSLDGALDGTIATPQWPVDIVVAPGGANLTVGGSTLMTIVGDEVTTSALPSDTPSIALTQGGGLALVHNDSVDGVDGNILTTLDDAMNPSQTAWTSAGPEGHAVEVVSDSTGNLVVLGQRVIPGNFPERFPWLRKVSPDGTELWTLMLDVDSTNSFFAAAVDSHDRIVVTGYINGSSTIFKLDPDGEALWETPLTDIHVRDLAVNSHDEIVGVGNDVQTGRGWIGAFAP